MNIARIREAEKSERFGVLMEELCGKTTDDSASTTQVLDAQIALKKLQGVRFDVSTGYHLGIFGPGERAKTQRVVVSQSIDGIVSTFKEPETYNAYEFLNDYLGIEKDEPMIISKLHQKYPKLVRDDIIGSEFPWYDDIAQTLLLAAKNLNFR